MQKRWLITPPISKKEIESLSNALKVSAVVAEILLQRDINDFSQAEQFFRPDIKKLHDPKLMKGMDLAVKRLTVAIEKNNQYFCMVIMTWMAQLRLHCSVVICIRKLKTSLFTYPTGTTKVTGCLKKAWKKQFSTKLI